VAARRPALLVLILLLGASCTGGAESAPSGDSLTSGPTSTAPNATTEISPGVPAELVSVYDGDTLAVRLDGAEEEVRLLGINAPEWDECFGAAAREAAGALLAVAPLLIEATGERDQFGRLLGYAWAGGLLVNLKLLTEGCALALQTDHPRLAEFLAAEEQAFTAGAGLWAAAACGPPAPAAVALADIEPDPPGPDQEDLVGEWVLVANAGDDPADLSGWVLRDESSQNRYRFPAGTILAPGRAAAVHTGCGEDGPEHLYWCAAGPVWNNGGDTALVLDSAGNVAARLRYGG
jgi:endonuclease YncB( thermonuclease family)